MRCQNREYTSLQMEIILFWAELNENYIPIQLNGILSHIWVQMYIFSDKISGVEKL